VLALLAVGLSVLLAIAAVLHPDPHHFGTHRQLGLPPCTFYDLFGVPCPTCGMTTAWAYALHGEIFQSLQANTGGALLAMLAIVAAPVLLVTAIRGRRFAWLPGDRWSVWIASGLLAVVLVQWGYRLIERYHG
jgi:hypothetical protein